MKKNILLIIQFLFLISAYAQDVNLKWAKRLGSTGEDIGNFSVVDAFGNVYTIGTFSGTVDFDPGSGTFNLTASGSSDVFILKLNALGNFVWAKQFGGSFFGNVFYHPLAIDTLGNIYITGYFSGTVDFDPGPGVFNLTRVSGSGGDIFVLKLNASGNFVWVKQLGIGTTTKMDMGVSITVDFYGNVYTMGVFGGVGDFDPGAGVFNLTAVSNRDNFLSKLDSAGNFVWAKQFAGGSSTYNCSIILDDMQNYICITGAFKGMYDFDPGPGTFNLSSSDTSYSDIFILKLDVTGNFVWAKQIGGPKGDDNGCSIAIDNMGNIYTTGFFNGAVDFDPDLGSDTLKASSAFDIFILKLDSSGSYIWAKRMGGTCLLGNYATSLALDALGNVYTTGYFSDTADFDPGAGIYNLITDNAINSEEIYISKLDSSGNFVWAKQMKGTTSSSDRGYSISLDARDNIYLSGYFSNTVDFNPETGTSNLISAGIKDIFIQKLSQNSKVWPGDTNNDSIVDNSDLLPIGLYYSQTGTPRASTGNLWQSYVSENWGIKETNGADITHVNCNGDGVIDDNDTLAVNLNFNLTHAVVPVGNQARVAASDLYFVTSSNTYNSSDIVNVEVWSGTSSLPVSNLYGIAFNIDYDASLVQTGTENLTYPNSWLGTLGTNAIKLSKVDALANTAYGAITRIDHKNADGYGKIADFKFQLKNSIAPDTKMIFSISGYKANDSIGASVLFNTETDSIIINPTATGINKGTNSMGVTISPNPFTSQTTISFNKEIKNSTLKVVDVIGKEVKKINFSGSQLVIERGELHSGIYFLQIVTENTLVANRKIVIQ